MKKARIIFICILLCLIVAICYFKFIHGWLGFKWNTDTPDKFVNHTIIKQENYKKDKSDLLIQFKNLLSKHEHEDFFYSKEYFEGTEILIDTIVYSPELDKFAILIITKNPTFRQLMPNANESWYYDATSYLGIRQKDSISLSWLGPNFSDYNNKNEISNDIRKACFRTFITKDTVGPYSQKYNLNDIRFWKSDVWKRIEEDKLKRVEFEEEKRKHPENVFEPTK